MADSAMEKRKREPEEDMFADDANAAPDDVGTTKQRRKKSRFDQMLPGGSHGPAPAPNQVPAPALGTAPAGLPAHGTVGAAQQAALALEKAKKAALMNKQIAEKLKNLASVGVTGIDVQSLTKKSFKAPALILDEEGRHVDETGMVVNYSAKEAATLKANINATRESSFKVEKAPAIVRDTESNPYYDPRMAVPRSQRSRRATFNFVEEGKFMKAADKFRSRALKKEIADQVKSSEKAKELATEAGTYINLEDDPEVTEPVPTVEWWDHAFVPSRTYEDVGETREKSKGVQEEKVTWYIEHPIPVTGLAEEKDAPPMPLMLTAKERKKLRRQNRLEREKDKQDQIRLGLMEPPKPKVKISNLMRVMGNDALQDPTKVEARVRMEMAQRQANHDQRNQERKLTKEQKKEKKKRQMMSDAARELNVALYRVEDMSNPKNKGKVDHNAQDLYLTGRVMLTDQGANLIIAEGGVKALRKFTKMVTRRINWDSAGAAAGEGEKSDGDSSSDEEETSTKKTKCSLIWQGTILKRTFKNFRFEAFHGDQMPRKFLENFNIEWYWDKLRESVPGGAP